MDTRARARTDAGTGARAMVTGLLVLAVGLFGGGCAIDPNRDRDAIERIDPDTISEARHAIEESRGSLLPDCDGNGVADMIETGPTRFGFVRETGPFPVDNWPKQALGADLDRNGRAEILSLGHPAADIEDGSLCIVRDEWIDADDRRADSVPIRESGQVRQAVAGDFTENGARDVVVLYEELEIRGVSHYYVPRLAVLRNEGDGALAHRRFVDDYILGTWQDDAYRMAVADYDRDRDLDLFVTWKDGSEATYGRGYKVALLTNRAERGDDGDLFDVRSSIATFYDFDGAITTADLDADGDLEVLVPYRGGTRGACRPPVCCATDACLAVLTPSWGDRWTAIHLDMGEQPLVQVAAGDVDRDGRPDLFLRRQDNDAVEVRLNLGSEVSDDAPIFGDPQTYAMGDSVVDFLLTDLNGNGDPDIVAVNRDLDQVTVRLGLGDGGFSRTASYATGPSPRSVATAKPGVGEFPALVVVTVGDSSLDLLRNTTQGPSVVDCNRNRRPDSCDIADGSSSDENRDNIPDECPTLRPIPPPGPAPDLPGLP